MATRSSALAWRIPCTEEAGGLQSGGGCKGTPWAARGPGEGHVSNPSQGGRDRASQASCPQAIPEGSRSQPGDAGSSPIPPAPPLRQSCTHYSTLTFGDPGIHSLHFIFLGQNEHISVESVTNMTPQQWLGDTSLRG